MLPATRLRTCLPFVNPVFRQVARTHKPTQPFRRSTSLQKTITNNKWTNFRSILTRWVPLSSAVYVGWCYIRSSVNYEVSKVEVKFYEMFPFRVTSRIWGRIAAYELPYSMRTLIYGTYVKLFKVDMSDCEVTDLNYYKSLSAFFTRPLRDGARYIARTPCVSPCDGVVLNCGAADTDKIEQVKGVTYSLEEFLGPNTWSKLKSDDYYKSLLKNKNNILHQCIIYLAPGDYHRFHSPCDWTISFRRHFSGKLLSVNPWMARLIPGLFTMNERATYIGEWKHGFFSMTAVGATNVGSIEIYTDPTLHTNCSGRKHSIKELDLESVPCKKGDLFGQFNMGSTIILLFEAPKEFKFEFCPGDRVLVGQAMSEAKYSMR